MIAWEIGSKAPGCTDIEHDYEVTTLTLTRPASDMLIVALGG